ncbi:hypothetical protein [Haloarcula amylolytica]|uniref:hypothetical protein n=1 Tax=Haloarcula amylolytica TaxID=396317 RepID=UPI003C72E5C2
MADVDIEYRDVDHDEYLDESVVTERMTYLADSEGNEVELTMVMFNGEDRREIRTVTVTVVEPDFELEGADRRSERFVGEAGDRQYTVSRHGKVMIYSSEMGSERGQLLDMAQA